MNEPADLSIVQFIHPGAEHSVPPDAPPDGPFPWNTGDHARKFLEADAHRLAGLDHQATPGKVRLWGEWEPPSRYRRLPAEAAADRGPTLIHEPYLPDDSGNDWRQNTDPLVFGPRFIYSNCQQYKRRRGGTMGATALQDLAPGSLILFGSPMYRPMRFFLDTVLVVGSREPFAPGIGGQKRSALFEEAVDRPLASGNDTAPKTLYYGSTWTEEPSGPFSFVPCVPTGIDRPWFPRPEIQPTGPLVGRVTPAKMQGFKHTQATRTQVQAAWQEVVRQVLENDLELAVEVACPGP